MARLAMSSGPWPAMMGSVAMPACSPSTRSCSMAAGRVVSSEAISTRFFSLVCSSRPNFADVVVLPEPCRPTIRMGAGGEPIFRAAFSWPRVSTRTSWTILTTCWPGVTERVTFSPMARGRTFSMKSFTTGKATSASISAVRTSPRAASTSASLSAPRPRSLSKTPLRRDCKDSNKLQNSRRHRRKFQRSTPQGAHLRCLGSIPRARRGTGKACGLSGNRAGFRHPSHAGRHRHG